MPITPLHLGLGTTCKGIGNHRFSLLIFSGVQVLMDIEPLLGMILGWNTLHLYTHNLIGALLIALIATPIGKVMSEFVLRRLLKQKNWQITWQVATLSALTGSFSHILLDGLMHADMYPFYPFSQTQFLLNLIPYSFIFYGCFIGFIFGGILFLLHEK
ncbi:DUF4184 family protein [Acinetobacter bereziniae]|uniref:DUF4184 family protein n=1 Tax=Acinetobacter bereziniae TaxID=106648 RepID=UPI0021E49569|nr:DUF4184 family protein [Acinetobacter bereziniae]MCV2444149.1 hydrolase [Acinetobacter bereziniae]